MPLSVTVAGEFVALLTTETLPVMLPPTVGAKTTLNVVFWPAVRVTGGISPLVLNPAPVTVACEIVRLALPELVKVTVCVLLVPTRTFPKARLVGLTLKAGCTPLPESVMVAGEFVALLTTETLPVTLPAAVGANVTLRVAAWLAARVSGRVKPLPLNPAPETFTCEMVTLELPLFVSVTVCVLLVPTNTLPKLKLVGLAESR